MKTYLLIFLSIVMSGCATVPHQPPESEIQHLNLSYVQDGPPRTDERCDRFAEQMKGIALLRVIGITADEATTMANPSNGLPFKAMVREIFSRPHVSPGDEARDSYAACENQSYEVHIAALRKSEVTAN